MDLGEEINARFKFGKKKKEELACCYCLARFKGSDVSDFTESKNGCQDVPLCPNCFVDKVVYFNKLSGDDSEQKMECLNELHEYWFEDTDSNNSDYSNDMEFEKKENAEDKEITSIFVKNLENLDSGSDADSDSSSSSNSEEELAFYDSENELEDLHDNGEFTDDPDLSDEIFEDDSNCSDTE